MKKINLLLVLLLSFSFVGCSYNYFDETSDEVWVHFIDVGQGDSTLIQSVFGNVLIDAGDKDKGQVVLNYLHSYGIDKLDYVIATHPHSDHIGGFKDIIENIYVESIIMPDVMHTTSAYKSFLEAIVNNNISVTAPKPLDTFELGDIKFTVMAPINDLYDNLNDYSVVLKMKYGKSKFLFTGDMEALSEHEVLNANYDISADVLKVAHHGSRTSSAPEFIKEVSPDVAVISAGKDNSYNHPDGQTLATLNNFNVEVLRTDEMGTIIIRTDGNNIFTN